MNTVREIAQALQQLAPQDLATFRAWYAKFDADAWDRQFEQDASSGRLDELADEALSASNQED